MMRSANPALNSKTFNDYSTARRGQDAMTLGGTVNKTAILLALCVGSAMWMWGNINAAGGTTASIMPWLIGSSIVGFILALVCVFKHTLTPYLAPVYALVKGVVLGAISCFAEQRYPGIVFQAVTLTFGTLFALLGAYRSGFIKATENFKLGVVAATGGIMIIYLVSFVLKMFGVPVSFIHEGSTFGIIFSLFVVVIAALNLVLDFDFIENGVEQGAPKHMEWYGAFGLIVTLIWLYIEILHLLMKLNSRD